MIKHIWSILCRRSIVDSETNNISLYDSLEELSVGVKVKRQDAPIPQAINIPIDYEVVSFWMKENIGSHVQADTEIEIVLPDGSSGKSFPQKIDMPEKMQRIRARYRIKGFGVSMPGTYLFRIKIKESEEKQFRTVSEIPLEVKIQKELDIKQ